MREITPRKDEKMERKGTGWLLDGDYPTEGQVDELHNRGASAVNPRAVRSTLGALRGLMHPVYSTWLEATDRDGSVQVYIATGGWSGNEELVDCLYNTVFWLQAWKGSQPGGGFIFRAGV